MTPRVSVGDRLPQAVLGRLVNGGVEHVALHDLVAGKRVVMIGVPGAFTPICTCEHVPDLVANADRLRCSGFDHVICIAPDNPWVIHAWAGDVDPLGKVLFLSDANLALARALGVNVVDYRLCLGETSARYLVMATNAVIRRFSVEPRIMDLASTRAADIVLID